MPSTMKMTACAMCIASVVVVASPPVVAVDKAKALSNMLKEAGRAYEEGNYQRATQLYWTAWQTAPEKTSLLYNAARTAHIAGQIERAQTLYRKFLALPNRTQAAVPKCEKHLAEIVDGRSDSLAESARRAASKGENARAATLYDRAASMSPRRPRYAELAKSQRALAVKASPTPPVVAPTTPKPPPKTAKKPPKVALPATALSADVAQRAPRSGPDGLAWALLGVAASGVGVTVALGLQSRSLEADYEQKIGVTKGGYIQWNRPDAVKASEKIGSFKTMTVIAGAVSTTALIGGLWRWLARAPAPAISVSPSPNGASFAVRF